MPARTRVVRRASVCGPWIQPARQVAHPGMHPLPRLRLAPAVGRKSGRALGATAPGACTREFRLDVPEARSCFEPCAKPNAGLDSVGSDLVSFPGLDRSG